PNLITIQRSPASGTANFRIFSIGAGRTVSISGVTLSNGNLAGTNFGGGVLNSGSLTLANCNIFGNVVDNFGAGIFNDGPSLALNNCNVGGTSAGQANRGIAAISSDSGGLSINGGAVVATRLPPFL